eukprot:CAMPEP_0204610626 /NCGR_PEP_ID=MMETSP0661-20131031/61603_1 /ASSEMBLY_ACC=CAM_ASM_000606 /TAXON_ID=109239 /ORGANISM="Alexandrium margalefi, Strain AMGDE01CS-322" /LENGTH=437 /DNA_ID=CAMNT_0051622445 /DNA_START=13 /DNA_END=1326 /DNA_ORIENTATION=+
MAAGQALLAEDGPKGGRVEELRDFWRTQGAAFALVFAPYSLFMFAVGLTMQAPYLLIVNEFGLDIAWVGFQQSSVMFANVVGGLSWQAVLARGPWVAVTMPLGNALSAAASLCMCASPNVYAFTAAASLNEFAMLHMFFEGFMALYGGRVTKCREWTGALLVGLRYAGALAGVPAAFLVARSLGTARGVYLAAAAAHAVLAPLSRMAARRLDGGAEEAGAGGREAGARGGHDTPTGGRGRQEHATSFAYLFLFTAFTELVRVSYPMTLNLKALQTPGVSPADTAAGLSLCNGIAVAVMFAAPLLMRLSPAPLWSAVPSFLLLGAGHAALAMVEGRAELLVSSSLFGLGEALSCGLRSFVSMHYRDGFQRSLGHLGARRVWQAHTNLQQLLTVAISFCIPWAGSVASMTDVSWSLAGISMIAALYSMTCMPTIPRASS